MRRHSFICDMNSSMTYASSIHTSLFNFFSNHTHPRAYKNTPKNPMVHDPKRSIFFGSNSHVCTHSLIFFFWAQVWRHLPERDLQGASYQTSVLQRVAVCCRVLQSVAECCRMLKCFVVYCSAMHRVAACCGALRCVAVCCSVLQVRISYYKTCNTLQHTATHCNTLQHTATHCNTLQHTATHITRALHPIIYV